MRVLLVNPSYPFEEFPRLLVTLPYVAAALRAHGHEVEILDLIGDAVAWSADGFVEGEAIRYWREKDDAELTTLRDANRSLSNEKLLQAKEMQEQHCIVHMFMNKRRNLIVFPRDKRIETYLPTT